MAGTKARFWDFTLDGLIVEVLLPASLLSIACEDLQRMTVQWGERKCEQESNKK